MGKSARVRQLKKYEANPVCLESKACMQMKTMDLTGCRFGKLIVLEDSGERRGNSVLWRCRCDCGGEILAVRHQLVRGILQSCGCEPRRKRQKVADLVGKRFGKLTVTGDSGLRSGGSVRWRCQCDCGGETLATRQQLVSGNVTSCGCVPKPRVPKTKAEDLTGRQFGELTVLRRVENDKLGKVCWLCRCSCGREVVVQAPKLKSGHTRSCGCKRYGTTYNRYDLAGQRFGRLTVLYPAEKPDRAKRSSWHCKCDCGNELDVYTDNLLRGLTVSCGCWNREQSGRMHEHMHYQNDTCVEILKRACADTGKNKCGFRGLFRMEDGRYRATITFQGKHYHLGYYTTFDRAVRARLDAEATLHMGYIRAFERYTAKAKEDPVWAENNPFFYRVTRVNGDFQIRTNGASD